jgi:hypothetical protein
LSVEPTKARSPCSSGGATTWLCVAKRHTTCRFESTNTTSPPAVPATAIFCPFGAWP